jgi:serine/threonine protein phosphatase PrpC
MNSTKGASQKKIERKNRRSKKKSKPKPKPKQRAPLTQRVRIIYKSSELVPLHILKNKNSGDPPHSYEDTIHRYVGKKFAIISLFDGHSGQFASNKAVIIVNILADRIRKGVTVNEKLFTTIFEYVDVKYLSKTKSGCTGTVVYIDKNKIYTAHVGDSPAYGISKNCTITQLTKDHDYFNIPERNRVTIASKKLHITEPWEDQRVHGIIQSSRGLGDPDIKNMGKNMFIAKPEVSKFNPKKFKYIMITSDGITDPLTEKYESRNLDDEGLTKLTDRQQSRNLVKNLTGAICTLPSGTPHRSTPNKILKEPTKIVTGIIKDAIKKVGNEYQDDISIILLDVKELYNYFNKT